MKTVSKTFQDVSTMRITGVNFYIVLFIRDVICSNYIIKMKIYETHTLVQSPCKKSTKTYIEGNLYSEELKFWCVHCCSRNIIA